MIFVCVCLVQNELPETNIIFYEITNAAESIKKIGSILMSIVESVDKERVSSTLYYNLSIKIVNYSNYTSKPQCFNLKKI